MLKHCCYHVDNYFYNEFRCTSMHVHTIIKNYRHNYGRFLAKRLRMPQMVNFSLYRSVAPAYKRAYIF